MGIRGISCKTAQTSKEKRGIACCLASSSAAAEGEEGAAGAACPLDPSTNPPQLSARPPPRTVPAVAAADSLDAHSSRERADADADADALPDMEAAALVATTREAAASAKASEDSTTPGHRSIAEASASVRHCAQSRKSPTAVSCARLGAATAAAAAATAAVNAASPERPLCAPGRNIITRFSAAKTAACAVIPLAPVAACASYKTSFSKATKVSAPAAARGGKRKITASEHFPFPSARKLRSQSRAVRCADLAVQYAEAAPVTRLPPSQLSRSGGQISMPRPPAVTPGTSPTAGMRSRSRHKLLVTSSVPKKQAAARQLLGLTCQDHLISERPLPGRSGRGDEPSTAATVNHSAPDMEQEEKAALPSIAIDFGTSLLPHNEPRGSPNRQLKEAAVPLNDSINLPPAQAASCGEKHCALGRDLSSFGGVASRALPYDQLMARGAAELTASRHSAAVRAATLLRKAGPPPVL